MFRVSFPTLLVLAPLVITPVALSAAQALTATSPDGKLAISFELKSNPQPYQAGERAYYRVTYEGKIVLTDSPLGLDFVGEPALDHGFEIVSSDLSTHDESWQWTLGARRNIPDRYNELRVSLRERQAPGRRLELIFRAYNEGVAFRYLLPQQDALGKFTLSSEETGFYFAQDVSAFALNLGSYTTSYESEFPHVSLDDIKPESIIGIPLLVEVPGGPWVGLLEADLTEYAGMYLGGVEGVRNALRCKLSPLPGHSDEAVIASTPKATPWRVLLVNPRPGGLIESDYLVLDLSAPTALADTSWIKPGKTAWDWWSGSYAANVSFQPGMNTATMEHYIDFAAEHHLPYMLIDAGWAAGHDNTHDITHWAPEVNLPEILAHAKSKGVRVILWMHWTSVKKQIDEAFPLFEKWGVAGVKIDFMDRNDQEMVNFYQEMAQKAAAHHLVVDFHGAYPPTGLRRAYPNVLTREGVMGMEYSKWSARVTPEHDVTLPFTRMLAGPMDYTPGCFNNATRSQFQPRHVQPMCQGTRAHQLAMYVDFLSPLEMLADYPEDYDLNPGMEFLDKVPTVWDETRVLNGEPAKYVTIARRTGETWYVGAMTNWDARDLELPLDFLGTHQYEAEIFADGPNAETDAKDLSITKKWVKAGDKLPIHLASGGGWAAILTPAP